MKFKYLLNYLNERFPFINMMLFGILYAMVYVVRQSVLPGPSHSFWFHFLGIIAVISFFFRLRVFDEMKDYQIDLLNHPQRVLQSGKITIRTLQFLALAGLSVELVWISYGALACQFAWLIALLYSVIMRYEFFIPKILNKNLLLYAVSHMLIMPLIIFWIWSVGDHQFQLNFILLYLLLLSLLSGFAFEIARKTHALEAERETVDSYSKQLGLKNAQYLILFLSIAMNMALLLLFYQLSVPIYLYVVIVLVAIWVIMAYVKTLNAPEERLFRKNEKKVSLMMLISYLSLILLQFI